MFKWLKKLFSNKPEFTEEEKEIMLANKMYVLYGRENMVSAIKHFREETGHGLKDAKAAIDAAKDRYHSLPDFKWEM